MKMFRALFNSTKVKLEEHEVEADQSSVTYTPPGSKVALLSAWEGPQHKWHKDRDDALLAPGSLQGRHCSLAGDTQQRSSAARDR